MVERRRYANTVSFICHLNLEKAPISSLDIYIGFHCHAIQQEDRDTDSWQHWREKRMASSRVDLNNSQIEYKCRKLTLEK
jgi:hypothetical protein